MIGLPNPWLIVGAAAFVGLSWWHGYSTGDKAATARHNAAIIAQMEAGEKLEAERREIARERDDLARQLEEAAYAEPVIVDRCLGPSRLRRLNSIR